MKENLFDIPDELLKQLEEADAGGGEDETPYHERPFLERIRDVWPEIAAGIDESDLKPVKQG